MKVSTKYTTFYVIPVFRFFNISQTMLFTLIPLFLLRAVHAESLPVVRVVDLDVDETRWVALNDGSHAEVELLGVTDHRDLLVGKRPNVRTYYADGMDGKPRKAMRRRCDRSLLSR